MKKIMTCGLVAAFLLAAAGCSMNKTGQGADSGLTILRARLSQGAEPTGPEGMEFHPLNHL